MSTSISCPPTSLSLPNKSMVSPLNRPKLGLSLNRTSPGLLFQSRFPTNKQRFLCYGHENFLSEVPGSEHIEDWVTPKCDQSKDFRKDWLSGIQKGTNAILGVVHLG